MRSSAGCCYCVSGTGHRWLNWIGKGVEERKGDEMGEWRGLETRRTFASVRVYFSQTISELIMLIASRKYAGPGG